MKKGVQIFLALIFIVGFQRHGFGIGFSDLQDLNIVTPAQLAAELVGAGNVVGGSVVYTGANEASGLFTNGLVDGIGINQGVILTSGDVFNAVGPNFDGAAGIDNFLGGDLDLDAILSPRVTFDASVLEFSFLAPPSTVTLTFNIVFASDEYLESIGLDFNDVFALFVNGQNIALVPGTTNPISINTLNNGATPSLYNDNPPLSNPPLFGTQYDGFSNVIQATLKVIPGNTYTIKLAIADGSPSDVPDAIVDSAVFVSAVLGDLSSLVTHYYNAILGRAPDPGGEAFWISEIERTFNLGVDVKEGLQALAKFFFNSQEYLNFGKDDAAFITDLYEAFLNRAPDPGGFAFWMNQIAQGLTRDMLILSFANSAEFEAFLGGIFGNLQTRPENNLVNDFYRGFLNRLPDTGGFNAWLALMRTAQCSGAQAVRDVSEQIALQFAHSAEYALRNRDNSGYIEDLYNAFLRRGADPAGFTAWVNALNTLTRDQVLLSFVNSPEFQLRVQEVINAGCLP